MAGDCWSLVVRRCIGYQAGFLGGGGIIIAYNIDGLSIEVVSVL